MWTIDNEHGDVLARFKTEEAALATFFNEAALERIVADFLWEHGVCSYELRLGYDGEWVVWH